MAKDDIKHGLPRLNYIVSTKFYWGLAKPDAVKVTITQGKALYWGTSEWSADEIRSAWCFADKHHLHKPVMEQPQYNLFHRKRVEPEYARLYDDIGLGLDHLEPAGQRFANGQIPQRCIQGQ